MRYSIVLSAVLTAVTATAFAQEPVIEWAKFGEQFNSSEHQLFFGADNQVMIEERIEPKGIIEAIVLKNDQFEEVASIELKKSKKEADQHDQGTLVIAGEFYHYNGVAEPGQSTAVTKVVPILDDGKSYELNRIKSGEKDVIICHADVSDETKQSAIYMSSIQKKSVREGFSKVPYLGYAFLYYKPRKEAFYIREHAITVLDESGKELWSDVVKLGNSDSGVYITEVKLMEDGNVFLIGRKSPLRYYYFQRFLGANAVKKLGARVAYKLSPESTKPVEIYFPDKIIDAEGKEENISVYNEGFWKKGDGLLRVATVGYYEKDGLISSSRMFAGFSITKLSGEKVESRLVPVDVYDLRNSLSKSDKKRIEKGKTVSIGVPQVRYAERDQDGGVHLIVEEYRVVTSNQGDGTYYYKNIVILYINNAGELEWTKIYEQNQAIPRSIHRERGGIGVIGYEGDFIVINNTSWAENPWDGSRGESIQVMKIDKDGRMYYKEKFKCKETPIEPRNSILHDEKIYMIGKGYKFVGVQAEDNIIGTIDL